MIFGGFIVYFMHQCEQCVYDGDSIFMTKTLLNLGHLNYPHTVIIHVINKLLIAMDRLKEMDV